MNFIRLSIACALLFAVAGCATNGRMGAIDPTIASYIEPKDIPWKLNAAGTYVTHFGKKIHYDGAKDEEAIIEVHGMGPATNTPAERKP